jgi:hypothetical protein
VNKDNIISDIIYPKKDTIDIPMTSLYFIEMNKKKTREAHTANSININFECGPRVEKGWARLC